MTKADLKQLIKVYKDFPKKGINFIDLNPILRVPVVMTEIIEWMSKEIAKIQVHKIVAVESRGFIFGAMLAYASHKPLILVRKPGKLPGKVLEVSYQKEYGKDLLELQTDALTREEKIVVVDDVLATGGTAMAVNLLIKSAGAEVVKFLFVAELKSLGGRNILGENRVNCFEIWD